MSSQFTMWIIEWWRRVITMAMAIVIVTRAMAMVAARAARVTRAT